MSLLEKLIDKFCHRQVCENAPPLSAFYRPSALPTVRTQYTIHGPGFQAENEISRMDGVSPTKKQLCVMEMEVNWTNILFMDQSTRRGKWFGWMGKSYPTISVCVDFGIGFMIVCLKEALVNRICSEVG